MLIDLVEIRSCEKLLICASTRLWIGDIDPILSPIGDGLISSALEINDVDVPAFIEAGIICRSCCIPISGVNPLFYSNYWDLQQASVAFSLIALNVPVYLAVAFAVSFCDLLSIEFEEATSSSQFGLHEIIVMAYSELLEFAPNFEPILEKYGIKFVAIKVAVDMLNMNAKFHEYFD